ncbi:MAG: FAD-binding oxidoreductase [Alphaproteobacteria bacterium]
MPNEPGLDASLWHATAAPAPDALPLQGDKTADVAIVGAGFTGCSAALHLAEKGTKVIVLEAKEVGWGGSGRNAGFVNAGMWLDPSEVRRVVGSEYGPRILEDLGHAPELVAALIARHGIECDPVRKGVLRGAHSARAMDGLAEHARQWQEMGANVEMLDRQRFAALSGSTHYVGGIVDHRSFSIQPLSYARGLARAAIKNGATIHTGTRVTALEQAGRKWRLKTATGTVIADRVILATESYSDGLWPGMRETFIPIGCYAYATEPLSENVRRSILPEGNGLYDAQPAMVFARFDRNHRLIVGSLGYLPRDNEAQARAWPRRTLRYLFPQLGEQKLSFRWAGTIGFTTDHTPRVHEPAPGIHIAFGYNGRGIAPGTMWGKKLAERVMGADESVFPLPVSPIAAAPWRGIRSALYEAGFSAYRLRSLFQ